MLPCGCLVGIYETYGGEVISLIDACAASCPGHRLHDNVTTDRPAPFWVQASSAPGIERES